MESSKRSRLEEVDIIKGVNILDLPNDILFKILKCGEIAKCPGSVCTKFENLRMNKGISLYSVIKNVSDFQSYIGNITSYKLRKLAITFEIDSKSSNEIGKLINFNLTHLLFINNNLGAEGAEHLAPEIGKLINLRLLGLMNNRMGDFGFGYILGMVSHFKLLKEVDFRQNNVSFTVASLQFPAFVKIGI